MIIVIAVLHRFHNTLAIKKSLPLWQILWVKSQHTNQLAQFQMGGWFPFTISSVYKIHLKQSSYWYMFFNGQFFKKIDFKIIYILWKSL